MSQAAEQKETGKAPVPEKAPSAGEQGKNGGRKGRRRAGLVLLALILFGVCLGSWLWYQSKIELTTDDAFIEAHIHRISTRVPGHVLRVLVEDNQPVSAGDLLVELDPADYRVRVARAEANLVLARNETSGDQATVEAERGVLAQEAAQFAQARIDLQRGESLYAKEVIPRERLDQLRTRVDVAQGAVAEAREKLRKAEALAGAERVGGVTARVAQREAELQAARLDLAYTRVLAPVSGYVTRKSVEIGNNVQAGQPLLALVQLENPWVVANYKESQLTHLEAGQKVDFTVDAYPGRTFTGRVDSIMAGTGAAFSLLPPENATGNYVKVVQRVPVKILIDEESDPEHVLRAGMSVVPTVYTGRSLGDILVHLNPFH